MASWVVDAGGHGESNVKAAAGYSLVAGSKKGEYRQDGSHRSRLKHHDEDEEKSEMEIKFRSWSGLSAFPVHLSSGRGRVEAGLPWRDGAKEA